MRSWPHVGSEKVVLELLNQWVTKLKHSRDVASGLSPKLHEEADMTKNVQISELPIALLNASTKTQTHTNTYVLVVACLNMRAPIKPMREFRIFTLRACKQTRPCNVVGQSQR